MNELERRPGNATEKAVFYASRSVAVRSGCELRYLTGTPVLTAF